MVNRAILAPLAGAALLASAGVACAQSCLDEDAAAVRCRFLLSEPRSLTVLAQARAAPATPSGRAMTILVDGRPCRPSQTAFWGRVTASCAVTLAAAEHVVEAQVQTPTGRVENLRVRLRPSGRLSELPREASTLYPRRRAP